MPKLGDTAFSVSWVPPDAVIVKDGEHDPDQAESVRVCRRFPTEAVAIQFARTVADYYGFPNVHEVEWMYWDEHSQSCMERPDWKAIRHIEVAHA